VVGISIRCLAAALLLAVSVPVTAQDDHPFVPGRIIVKFKDGGDPPSSLPARVSTAVEHRFRSGARLVRIRGLGVEEALEYYRSDPRVEYAEPDYLITLDQIGQNLPDDPRLDELYAMDNHGQTGGTSDADIDAAEAWTIRTDSDVLMGVIDTGIDWHHEDLAANVFVNPGEIPGNGIDDDQNGYIDDVRGWDFVNHDNDPMDDHYHGTHVSGTIAAIGNNGIGVAGVCWRARLLPLKILNSGGNGSMSAAVEAIEYATAMGVRVTNNSWGSPSYSRALDDALAEHAGTNALFIAAAGNYGRSNELFAHYPASYPYDNIIAVASTNDRDTLSVFSNYGAVSVDLGAPGEEIISLVPGNSYGPLSGTSMASPHVTGAVGLILSEAPLMTPAQVKEQLLKTVDPLPALQGQVVSQGRLNVYRSLAGLDAIPPGGISDLKVTHTGSNTVTLSWTASGDDGMAGTAAACDIRYDTSPIKPSTFERATPVASCPAPAPAGTPQSFRVTGLEVKTTYFFAIRVLDERLNPSAVSRVVAGRTRGIPEVSFSPSSFDGAALTGATDAHVIKVTNSGKGTIDFDFSGDDYGWVRFDPATGTIPARESATVNVTFDALGLAGGDYGGILTMATNDPGTPLVELPVRFAVTSAPHLMVSEAAVDFGGWFVGARPEREVRVINRGDRPLSVTGFEVEPADAGFSVDVAPFTLPPSGEKVIVVHFAPPQPEVLTATLVISSDDPDDPRVDVALGGRGLPPPDISLTPDHMADGMHTGGVSVYTATIANDGTSNLDWNANVEIATGKPDPSRGPDNTGPFRDLAGVRVLYDAAHQNLHWFNYHIVFSDLRSRGAEILVSKSAFTREYLDGFDAVWMAEAWLPLEPEELDALAGWVRAGGGLLLEGDYDPSVSSFNAILGTLLSGIEVRYQNGATGVTTLIEDHETTRGVDDLYLSRATASLRVVHAPARALVYDVDGVCNVAWSRSGAGRLVVMADQDLANHRMGEAGNEIFGNRIIDWLALGVSWLSVSPADGGLEPGQTQDLTLVADAAGIEGVVDARLVVRSNDPDEPAVTMPVHINVQAAPDIVVSPSPLRFPRTAIERSAVKRLTVGNTGTDVLRVGAVTTSDNEFEAPPDGLAIAPGAAVVVPVAFAPTASGERAATIVLECNDPDNDTASVLLEGEGYEGAPGTVTLSLQPGLNLRSWNLDTADDAPGAVFSEIMPWLRRAFGFEDGQGVVFDPDPVNGLRTLERLDHLRAYWIETTEPTTLTVAGFVVDPHTPIPLRRGWNTISYLPRSPDTPAHALEGILGHVEQVVGYQGEKLTYTPSDPEELNTLTRLEPGYGYWVKMAAADTLVYPDTTVTPAAEKPGAGPALAEATPADVPARTVLHPNVPNPFNPTTVIRYDVRDASRVTLIVYNVRGQRVRTLVDEVKTAGSYTVTWNGTTDTGAPAATGVYFCRLVAGDFHQTRKMLLLK
jgi:subtilisin family serine protease